MPASNALRLKKKAKSSFLASVEIYNKPDFYNREEIFCILIINAWECLLKARILQELGNINNLYIVDNNVKKIDGSKSKRKLWKKNRSGNRMTLGLDECCTKVMSFTKNSIDVNCYHNILMMMEIRDNAVHFLTDSADIKKSIEEASLACVRNFLHSISNWFEESLDIDSAILPVSLSFNKGKMYTSTTTKTKEMLYFVSLFDTYQKNSLDDSKYEFTVEIDISVSKSKGKHSADVAFSKDEDAIKVNIPKTSEDKIPEKFSWSYATAKYNVISYRKGIRQNKYFHAFMKKIKENKNLVFERYFKPDDPKSGVTCYYNPSIIGEINNYFTKEGLPNQEFKWHVDFFGLY